MKKTLIFSLLFIPALIFGQGKLSKHKKALLQSIEKHQKQLIEISDKIWEAAETAFEETKSAEILANYAEENGFTVERGVAEIPTAFVATYGSGKPVISILGEFDALPGISQKTVPTKDPLIEGGNGHTLRCPFHHGLACLGSNSSTNR